MELKWIVRIELYITLERKCKRVPMENQSASAPHEAQVLFLKRPHQTHLKLLIQIFQAKRKSRLFIKQGSGKNAWFLFFSRDLITFLLVQQDFPLRLQLMKKTKQHAYWFSILCKSQILETRSFSVLLINKDTKENVIQTVTQPSKQVILVQEC